MAAVSGMPTLSTADRLKAYRATLEEQLIAAKVSHASVPDSTEARLSAALDVCIGAVHASSKTSLRLPLV